MRHFSLPRRERPARIRRCALAPRAEDEIIGAPPDRHLLPQPTVRGRALVRELKALLGEGSASCEPADLWASSRDCWPRALLQTKAGQAPHPPEAVAWPADAAQVSAMVRWAAPHRVPLVPQGSGSGVCGGAVPIRGGVALDLKRLAPAPRIDLESRTVDVSAGQDGRRLEELLSAQGATLGHFPSRLSAGTVGGWLATRSAGQCSSRYGKIEDLVLSLEAVDGTGAILRTLDGPSAGPDLTQLLVGSEGTLAVITRARLRIFPKPVVRWMRGVRFSSLEQGLRGLQQLLRSGLRPAFARLRDPLGTLLAAKGAGAAQLHLPEPLRWVAEAGQSEALRLALRAPLLLNRLVEALPAACLLVLGFEGDGSRAEEDAEDVGAEALRLCSSANGEDLGPAPGERWLATRYNASFRAAPLFAAGGFSDVLEMATTWDRLPALHAAVREALAGHAFVLADFTHASLEGCAVEFTLVGHAGMSAGEAARSGDRDEVEEDLAASEARLEQCTTRALSAAADVGATLSHHHGIGLSKQLLLPREHGEGMRQLRALKKAFDPHGILNPGKLLL